MKNQVLSAEQMQYLMELGIDASKASMSLVHLIGIEGYIDGGYLTVCDPYWICPNGYINDGIIPTFTFQDVLDMLPKHINAGNATYFLSLLYDDSDGVVITYCTDTRENVLHSEGNSKQIDAAFNMLKWRKQNNYLIK